MAKTLRVIESKMIDNYVPQAILCMACSTEIDLTTAHYGRVSKGFQHSESTDIHTIRVENSFMDIPITTEKYFPVKTTGYACVECWIRLYNTAWRDKNGELRRAFENLHLPVEQPKNDDYDAAKVTKGLYAPHIGKRSKDSGRPVAGYFEGTPNKSSSVAIDYPAKVDRKLKGFNKFKREDIKTKGKRVIVKGGKWKVDPASYDYRKGGTK